MKTEVTQWLLESDEPWTRYRTLVDLLDRPEDDPEVRSARAEMLAHPQVQGMMAETVTWGERAFKRHNHLYVSRLEGAGPSPTRSSPHRGSAFWPCVSSSAWAITDPHRPGVGAHGPGLADNALKNLRTKAYMNLHRRGIRQTRVL